MLLKKVKFLQTINLPLLILMINMFIALLGVGLVIPVLPQYLLEFGAHGKELGYLVAAMALTQFLFSPLGGEWSDKYGRKKIIVWGMAILALSQLIFCLATELWLLYLSRFVGGVGIAFVIPATMAYVADVTTEENRGKGMGLLGASLTLGFVFSPGIGGFLAEYGLRVPFYMSAAVAVIATLASLGLLQETISKEAQLAARESNKKKDGLIQPFVKSVKTSYLWLLVLVLTLSFGLASFESIFGLYVDRKFGFTPKDIAILMTVGAIVGVLIQAVLIGWLLKRFGEKRLINLGFFLSGLFTVLILLSGNFWFILIINVLFVAVISILRPAINTLLSKQAGSEQGYVAGMNNAYGSLGNILGPSLAGILFDFGVNLPFLLGAMVLFLSLAFSLYWNRKKSRGAEEVIVKVEVQKYL